MKKTLCLLTLICVLLAAFTAADSAQTVEPVMPEALRNLLAGKTFIARMDGYACDEEMQHVILYWQICEQETYKPEEIEALQAGDILMAGGSEFAIQVIEKDEFGYNLTGESYSLSLYKNEAGMYIAVSDTENRFYKNLFEIEAAAPSDLRFLDWGDPEAEEPTECTLQDLMNRYMNNEIFPAEYNTEITFDENGTLTEITYRYSPWN